LDKLPPVTNFKPILYRYDIVLRVSGDLYALDSHRAERDFQAIVEFTKRSIPSYLGATVLKADVWDARLAHE